MYYLADGSSQIGLGHLYRCAALALSCEDAAPILLTASPELAQKVWPASGTIHAVAYAPHDLLPRLAVRSVVVADSYAIDDSLCHTLERAGHVVIRLDDYAAEPISASVILNHAADPDDYRSLQSPWSRCFAGVSYAVVRPAFRASPQAYAESSVRHALVCLGGADPENLTTACVRALAQWGLQRITVVVGPAWSHSLQQLHAAASGQPLHIEHHVDAQAMVRLMDSSDLVVGSASTVAIEACCRLRPCIAIQYADNQLRLAQYLAQHALALVISPDQIGSLTRTSLPPARLLAMVQAQLQMVSDASSLPAVAGYAHKLARVAMRTAEPQDCEQVLQWANDSGTRRYSVYPEPISPEDHQRWYAQTLQHDRRILLIGELDGQRIGYVRLDCPSSHHPQAYAVSIALDPTRRGQGLSIPLLAAGLRHYSLHIHAAHQPPLRLMAVIHPDNYASQKLFGALGFQYTGSRTLNAANFMIYEK